MLVKQLKILSLVLLVFSCSLLLTLSIGIFSHEQEEINFFLIFLFAVLIPSLVTLRLVKRKNITFHHTESILYVFFTWIFVSIVAAIPFYCLGNLRVIDSFFESVSGLTTTGATSIVDVESLSSSLLVYRSTLSFLGGLGLIYFIYLFISNIGGNNLTRIENGRGNEKNLDHNINTTYVLFTVTIYFLSLIIFTLIFKLTGVGFVDSLVLALGGISTGGFSSKNAGFSSFSDNSILIIIFAVLMLLSSINFYIYFNLFKKRLNSIKKNSELKLFILITFFSFLVLFVISIFDGIDSPILLSIRDSFFNVSSFISTSGFTHSSFFVLSESALFILIILMFVGGCSSSNAAGFRVFRLEIIVNFIVSSINKKIHPNIPLKIRGDNYNISDITKRSISYLSSLFVMLILLSFVLALDGFSVYESFSGSVGLITNTGVGGGHFMRQSGFSDLSGFAKIISSFSMLFARLEGIALFSIFTSIFWRNKA